MKNIIVFIKNYTWSFIVIALTQIIAIIAIFLSYGSIVNNEYVKKTEDDEVASLQFQFNPEETNKGEKSLVSCLKDNILPVLNESSNVVESFFMNMSIKIEGGFERDEGNIASLDTSFRLDEKGNIVVGGDVETYGTLVQGDYFSDEDLVSGQNICIVSNELKLLGGERWELGGKTYTAITEGIPYNMYCDFMIPFMSIPDSANVNVFVVTLKRRPTKAEYNRLKEGVILAIEDYHPIDDNDYVEISLSERMTRQMLRIICFIMVVLATITTCAMYGYIINKQQKNIKVFLLCGASEGRIIFSYIKEIFVIMLFFILVGMLLFIKVIKPACTNYFVWFSEIFNKQIYVVACTIYCIVIGAMMAFLINANIKKNVKFT